ncbi:biopolymer transporter ExbD [uncultured Roseibium sp.]|uniref:biopolymer transporter ExbD n=1 Tax=uncultured Roseibium sp. TaxID=1936171 RepID=UPI002627E870|nr:biopolymer transporter ExbD [uncultured Roseibium sp.]
MKRYTKPIHVPKPLTERKADSSLALINVVFLLLLFLLVSGTLRPPLPEEFEWAETIEKSGEGDIQNSLVISKEGTVWFEGAELDDQALNELLTRLGNQTDKLSIQVDRRAKMAAVAANAERFRTAGIRQLSFITIETE